MTTTLALLTGPDAAGVARLALAALGQRRGAGAVERRRVHHRPGADTTVSFAATPAGGTEVVVLVTDADVPAPAVPLEVSGQSLRAWLHPLDPRLPALGSALDPREVRGWLGPAASGVRIDLLSYRPLRRAVVRAAVGERRFFVKVWRPERAEGLIARHRALDAAGLGPRVVAVPAPGALVIADAEGVPLATRLAEWNAHRATLPEPAAVLRLLERLPESLLRFPVRASWSDRVDFHGAAAAAALPDHADEIQGIAGQVRRLLADRPETARVPTHGDFYEANVFVGPAGFTTLIDVDTAGPGRRVDDLACLLGHLAVLPDLSPGHYHRLPEVTQAWAAAFERVEDPVALRARVAGVLLSLVAGTTRPHALARLDLCRSWLYRAENG
nr:aminoglycoside phosphotransferase family protein [Propionibacterium sp.]